MSETGNFHPEYRYATSEQGIFEAKTIIASSLVAWVDQIRDMRESYQCRVIGVFGSYSRLSRIDMLLDNGPRIGIWPEKLRDHEQAIAWEKNKNSVHSKLQTPNSQ